MNSPARTAPAQSSAGYDIESEVARRYGAAAEQPEAALCCPSDGEYDTRLLAAIPDEVLAVDYGCGDPSSSAREGEVVLDLGSGSGKACFMLAQRVGAAGRVIGVDANDAMLTMARRHTPEVARRIGFANVEFVKARIQDLRLDLALADAWLAEHPIADTTQLAAFEAQCARQRAERPLVADESVDLVVSNCVLNLVSPEQKSQMFRELHRVLRRGGRAVISDIVCDEDPTASILADPELWSGCIAGAFREDLFLAAFEAAGFYGIEITARSEAPWRTVDGIEFRSLTVQAFKGKEGACLERDQAVIYRGPWKSVRDDDGHTFPRGERIAVCDKTFVLLTAPNSPYARSMAAVPPHHTVALEDAKPFTCNTSTRRDPRATKGLEYRATFVDGTACTGPECC